MKCRRILIKSTTTKKIKTNKIKMKQNWKNHMIMGETKLTNLILSGTSKKAS